MKNLFLTLFTLLSINLFSQCENDSINPYFVNFEPEVTISCDVDLNVVFPVALDECDDSVEIAWYEETTNIYCDNSAYDQCGNTSYSSQTIISIDTVPPVINGPIYLEVNEGNNIDTLFVTVTDNCSSFNVTYVDTEVSSHSIIRDYTATDYCGNESTFEQIIHINHDEEEEEGGGGNNRVAICHNLGNGEWITIYVAQPAVQAHLNHGDYLGPCTEMVIDWQQILPNSDLQMRVIKGKDNKYKKFVRVR